jgi:hypothetical protein
VIRHGMMERSFGGIGGIDLYIGKGPFQEFAEDFQHDRIIIDDQNRGLVHTVGHLSSVNGSKVYAEGTKSANA